MKKLYLFCLVAFALQSHAQPGTWTWISGDSIGGIGSYGVLGVPSITNAPSARYADAFWTDTAGNFWLYGGDQRLNDLWTFNPGTLEWTWFGGSDSGAAAVITAPKGVYNSSTWPGAVGIGVFSWVTPDNHFWLYGGLDDPNGNGRATLWQYDPNIHQWAWMGGLAVTNGTPVYGTIGVEDSLNTPGGRFESNDGWVDSAGNLWLYGGYSGDGVEPTIYGDLWQYDVNTGYWVCQGNRSFNYGTKGVSAATNYPPYRETNLHWKDDNGKFWLSGGFGIVSVGGYSNPYQDVWRFDPVTKMWTWMGGPSGHDSDTSFSVGLCDTSARNVRGARYENRAVWKVSGDLVLNAGGWLGAPAAHDDLWAYFTAIDRWVKTGEWPAIGKYNTKLVADSTSHPGARIGPSSWVDRQGNLWLFGGTAIAGSGGSHNDLWKYVLDTSCLSRYCNCWGATPVNPLQVRPFSINSNCTSPCNGQAQAVVTSGTAPFRYLWTPDGDTNDKDSDLCAGTYIIKITDAAGAVLYDTFTITAPIPPAVTISPDTVFVCNGDTATICASTGFGVYDWSDGASGICISTQAPGNYNVTVTDKNACKGVSNYAFVSLLPSVADTVTHVADTLYSSSAQSYQWYLNGAPVNGATAQTYVATIPGNYSVKATYPNGCSTISNAVNITVNDVVYLAENGAVKVWPNPSSGSWQVAMDKSLIGSRVEVFDDGGKLVYQSKAESADFELNLDVASGVYLLRIRSVASSYVQKLIRF